MLYPSILYIFTGRIIEQNTMNINPSFDEFSYSYTCLLLVIVLFILGMKKDVSVFLKLSSYGVIFTFIIILFIIYTGITSL